jgi:hypothetical protein
VKFCIVLLFVNSTGHIIKHEQPLQDFSDKNLCEIVAQVLAGQKSIGPRTVIIPACIPMRACPQ